MKLISLETLAWEKIQNRKGLFQKNIAVKQDGAKNFSFHLSLMEAAGYGAFHSHPDSEHLLLVTKGELEVRSKEKVYKVPAGSAILIYPGEGHEIINVHSGVTEYFVIYSPPV